MDRSAIVTIVTSFVLGTCSLAHAQSATVRLAPVADGSLVDQSPFDGIPDGSRRTQSNVVFLHQGVSDFRAVIEFDLAGLVDLAVVNASLELMVTGKAIPPELAAVPIEIRSFPADGFLRKSDFHRGTFLGVFDAFAAPFDVPVPIDVTAQVRRALASGRTFIGFTLRTTSGAQIDFGSLESAWGPPPALVITSEGILPAIAPK